jgi:hypothetical protein
MDSVGLKIHYGGVSKSDQSFSRQAFIRASGNKHTKYFALKWSAGFVILLYDKELKYKIPEQKTNSALRSGCYVTLVKTPG